VQHSESRKIMSRKIMRADNCRLVIGDSQAKPENVQISFDWPLFNFRRPEDQMRVTVAVTPVNSMGTREPNEK
jgi:hypothetical protein